MERMACVVLPEYPLQLLLKRNPQWLEHPVAVVDRDKAQGKLLWVNERARALRILPGLRYSEGLSLSHELRAGVVTEEDLQTQTERLLRRLRFYSADVEPSQEPGVFWLSARGLSLLFPSLQKWTELIHSDVCDMGYQLSVVAGFSRFGSYATAKSQITGTMCFREEFEEEIFAKAIRIERLGFKPELRDALAQLGVFNLGQFLELPSNGVRKRFGAEVHNLYQLAKGELWAPVQGTTPVEPARTALHLDHPEMQVHRLLVILEELLRNLMGILNARNETLQALHLNLQLDDGRETTEVLRPAEPTFDMKQLLELLRLRLENIALSAGVVHLELHIEGILATREQLQLFQTAPNRDLKAASRALARIRAELGDEAVAHAVLKEGHLPEARFTWEPVTKLETPKPRNVQTGNLIRRVFQRPIALSIQPRNEPDGWMITGLEDGPVEEIVGPYIVTGGWWRRDVFREYHFVRARRNGWLWVYFDRLRRRWYWQGCVE